MTFQTQNYTLAKYQEDALSFRLPSASPLYALLNLAGEVGELNSLVAKSIRDGRKEDFDLNVKKELGDVLWSVAAVAADHGFSLEEVAMSNILKLSIRKTQNTLQGSGDNR
jgi:NTP pyrophosphatase (non-canonical NTP hydrolase)